MRSLADIRRKSTMTVTTRISLWFTIVLVAICALMLIAAATAYGEYGKQAAREELVDAVREEATLIEDDRDYREKLDAGDVGDAEFAKDDVQLMIYDDEGRRYAGLFLRSGLNDIPLDSSDRIRSVSLDGAEYFCYDEHVHVPRGGGLWVRGIIRSEASVWNMLERSGFLMWLIPILVLIAFFGGRLLTSRLLHPIKEIASTARSIRASGDLSRRVPHNGSGDELSSLAEDINGMFDTLEKNFEAERSFTSNASHELRTPIAVILAECEYAEDNASGEDELRESIAVMHRQGAKMSRIVEALLTLTRIEQSTVCYVFEHTDLNAFITKVCDDFAAISQSVRLERAIADGVNAVVNRELVEVAVDNLLRNAARYGGEDVTVRVELASIGGFARITVADNGPGIPDELLERVWEVFFRADAARSTEGLGVGLPLVRRIAEYHGGSARVESAEGKGATFTVDLPLAPLRIG